MRTPPPDIFAYADFRTYLSDWFSAKKTNNPRFSHRAFARLVGTKDPSTLLNIVRDRRRIGPDRIEPFVRALDLEGAAAQYFRLLVRFGQADDRGERDRAWAELALLRSELHAPEVDAGRFLYLSRWIYPAIRELAQCKGFRPDPEWIASSLTPRITPEEASGALELLLRLGLLERQGTGFTAAEPVVRTSESVVQLASYAYHQQNHELAGRTLDRLWRDDDPNVQGETAFVGLTLAVPESRIPELRRMLWEAQLKVLYEVDNWRTEWDRVVQLNIHLFPVSVRTSAGD